MATFNQPICLNSTTNTGTGSCSFRRAPIKYVITVPNAFTLTTTTFGNLITTLQTRAVSPIGMTVFISWALLPIVSLK